LIDNSCKCTDYSSSLDCQMAGDGKGCSWTPGILWGLFGGSCVGSCTTLGLVGKCVPKHGFADSVCYRGSQAATGVDSTVRIAQSRVLVTGQVDAYCVEVTLTPDSCGDYTSSSSCRGTSGCAWTALLPDSLLPNDSCEWAKDGRCDEPLIAAEGLIPPTAACREHVLQPVTISGPRWCGQTLHPVRSRSAHWSTTWIST
jgi:hypothetical protein